MIKKLVLIFLLVGLLTACGNDQNEVDGEDEPVLEAIEVDLQAPETTEVDQQVTITAFVTQGEEAVDDAEYVEFEIWEKDNKEASQTIESEHNEGGEYFINHSFTKEGIYQVQSHVQARDMHTMPIAEVTVSELD